MWLCLALNLLSGCIYPPEILHALEMSLKIAGVERAMQAQHDEPLSGLVLSWIIGPFQGHTQKPRVSLGIVHVRPEQEKCEGS